METQTGNENTNHTQKPLPTNSQPTKNVDDGFVNIINSGFLVSKRKLCCCVGGRDEN